MSDKKISPPAATGRALAGSDTPIISTAEKKIKKRHWGAVVYPDSAPSDWRAILAGTGLPIAISPLHDEDTNPTGEPKKPHYHIIMCWEGPTAFSIARRITDKLNAPIPIPLESVRGAYRYLTHADNPEKAQYSETQIECLNGFSILNFTQYTRAEIVQSMQTIQSIIRRHGILEYSDLMDILLDAEMHKEWEIAATHTLFCAEYIKSQWRKSERGQLERY